MNKANGTILCIHASVWAASAPRFFFLFMNKSSGFIFKDFHRNQTPKAEGNYNQVLKVYGSSGHVKQKLATMLCNSVPGLLLHFFILGESALVLN